MRRPVTKADTARAAAAEKEAARTEFRARRAAYDPGTDRIEIGLRNGLALSFPRAASPDLASCPADAMAELEVWPTGCVIAVESADMHVSSHGLVSRLLGIPPGTFRAATVFAVEAVPLAGRNRESGLLSLHGTFAGMRAALLETAERLSGDGWTAGAVAEIRDHGESRLEAELSKGRSRMRLTGSEWFVQGTGEPR